MNCFVTDPVSNNLSNSGTYKCCINNNTSLSGHDLEDDTLHSLDATQKILPNAPDSVPGNFPRVKLEKGRRRGCLAICCTQQPSEEKSTVFIQHFRATDSCLGDKFGADIETVHQPDKTGYYRHYLTDIENGGVAYHMKIRPRDQLVMLNEFFVPDLNHEDVIGLFSKVPVDSHTKLTLILLRFCPDKRQWEWISSSALLVPEYLKEPIVRNLQYEESFGRSTEDKHMCRLNVDGTELYLTLSDGKVMAEVSKLGKSVDKYNICIWQKLFVDECTGDVYSRVCLYREEHGDRTYVNAQPDGFIIGKNNPQWFGRRDEGCKQSYEIIKDNESKHSISSICSILVTHEFLSHAYI